MIFGVMGLIRRRFVTYRFLEQEIHINIDPIQYTCFELTYIVNGTRWLMVKDDNE